MLPVEVGVEETEVEIEDEDQEGAEESDEGEAAETTAPWLPERGAHAMGPAASFYVEYVQPGMEPPRCSFCHRALGLGQMRLGYAPCDSATPPGMLPPRPRWVHALRCARRAHLVVRQTAERVAFSPALSALDRGQVLEELSQLAAISPPSSPSGRSRLPSPLAARVRPWPYQPAVVQGWAQQPVPDRRAPRPPRTPPPTPVAAAARAAMARSLVGAGALHVQEVLAQLLSEVVRQRPDEEAAAAEETSALLAAVPAFTLGARAPELCVVCREPMLPAERCRRLPCLHLFHQECIDRWLRVKATCPLDKMRLSEMLAAQRSIAASCRGDGAGCRSRSRRRRSRSRSHARAPSAPDHDYIYD